MSSYSSEYDYLLCATKSDLVTPMKSDHNMLDVLVDTNVGALHIYSLNLLTRQCVTFRQSREHDEVNVRLNFPISWLLNTKREALVSDKLQKEGKALRPIEKMISLLSGKKQLELIDISTGHPSRELPSPTRIYVETEEEYFERIRDLGMLVGQKMHVAIRAGERVIFALQELRNDVNSMKAFITGVNLNKDKFIQCYYEERDDDSACMPALLYDSRQLLPLDRHSIYAEKIIKFERDFAKLLRGSEGTGNFADFIAVPFKDLMTEKIICAASIHADFATINKEARYDVMVKMADISREYCIIIAGDFNRKVQSELEIKLLHEAVSSRNTRMEFIAQPTNYGLQLHDTLDAIFSPAIYPAMDNLLSKRLINSFLLFKEIDGRFLIGNRHENSKAQHEYDKKFALTIYSPPGKISPFMVESALDPQR